MIYRDDGSLAWGTVIVVLAVVIALLLVGYYAGWGAALAPLIKDVLGDVVGIGLLILAVGLILAVIMGFMNIVEWIGALFSGERRRKR